MITMDFSVISMFGLFLFDISPNGARLLSAQCNQIVSNEMRIRIRSIEKVYIRIVMKGLG